MNPVYAYLVEHPQQGFLLLDTGLHPSFAEQASGNFGLLLGTLVKTRTEKGWDIVSQLKNMGISPDQVRYVILSHLHLDHPSSLPLLRENRGLTVFADEDELNQAKKPFSRFKGYIYAHLKGLNIQPLQYKLVLSPFEQVADFFGDGSLFVIRTPGHSPGHVSVLLNASAGPILLTFDAAHRQANLDDELPPIGEYAEALASVRRLNQLIEQYPDMRVIYSHDPDQLSKLKRLPEHYA
jgi:glyoxylase-like metal-dependent hydrolase (beta-lactamase superfamily II)